MGNTKDYNSQYWKANRKRLLKERAERYRQDQKYRMATLARSKAAAALERIVKLRVHPMVVHNGVSERRFCFSDLCEAANRAKFVLYRWREIGVLPKPLYCSPKGYGYYSESQVKFLGDMVNRIDNEDYFIIYPMMGKVLHRVWPMTYSAATLTAELAKEMGGNAKEDRSAFNFVSRKERRSVAKEGEGEGVQQGARDYPGKYGDDSEHGELPESPTRRGSSSSVRPSRRRSGVSKGREVRAV